MGNWGFFTPISGVITTLLITGSWAHLVGKVGSNHLAKSSGAIAYGAQEVQGRCGSFALLLSRTLWCWISFHDPEVIARLRWGIEHLKGCGRGENHSSGQRMRLLWFWDQWLFVTILWQFWFKGYFCNCESTARESTASQPTILGGWKDAILPYVWYFL